MNIMKHMEAVFIVAMGVAVSGSYLIDSIPEAQARPYTADAAQVASGVRMAVVTVTAKRLSPEEKAAGSRG
ncbi:MAG: hypothetical protein ACRYGO_03710 [Janthinobacterium lividum]